MFEYVSSYAQHAPCRSPMSGAGHYDAHEVYDGSMSFDRVHADFAVSPQPYRSTPPRSSAPLAYDASPYEPNMGMRASSQTSSSTSSASDNEFYITPSEETPCAQARKACHEYTRRPSGIVTTTRGGQAIEFWEGAANIHTATSR